MAASPAAIARANQHRAYLIKTHKTKTVAQQARALGIAETQVRKLRQGLMRAGHISASTRARSRHWTTAEWQKVVTRLRAGDSTEDAGRAVKRSADAVVVEAMQRRTSIAAVRAGYVWSLEALAVTLSIPVYRLTLWIADGTLTVRQSGEYRITRAAVEALLSNRLCWPYFDPDAITDTHLRAYARGERIRSGGRWVPLREMAQRLNYEESTLRTWVRIGKLEAVKIGRAWHIWEAVE